MKSATNKILSAIQNRCEELDFTLQVETLIAEINNKNNKQMSKEKAVTGEESFLPEGYVAPSGESNYLRLQDGENRFRIVSKRPILGWIDWKDNKPLRFPMDKKPASPVDPKKKVKHFWAFVVYDYTKKKICILEITQSTIQTAISNLSKDKDWGMPTKYDIKIFKKGANLETEYSVNPVPHKEIDPEVVKMVAETPVDIEKLFTGENPFGGSAEHVEENIDPLPF